MNTLGLVINIFGSLLILWRGLPPLIKMIETRDTGSVWYEWELEDEANQSRMKRLYDRYKSYKRYMITGAIFIIFGFLFQAISNYLPKI